MNRKERRAALAEQHRYVSKLSDELTLIPVAEWPVDTPPKIVQVWRSRKYLVQIYDETTSTRNLLRLSICRVKMGGNGRWQERLSWDELQAIKRDVGFGDWYGVEVYPRDCNIVNDANMRHLWLMPVPLPIGWF